MWRLWTAGWGPRDWWYWLRTEGFPVWVANHLPHDIALRTFIRVVANDPQSPCEAYTRIYKAWEAKRSAKN